MTGASGETLTGMTASTGIQSGEVVVLEPRSEPPDGEDEIILVAEEGTPDITPHVLQSDAVVLEKGSMSSHIAKVCREFGLPCVFQVESATDRMITWSRARVDGDEGKIVELS